MTLDNTLIHNYIWVWEKVTAEYSHIMHDKTVLCTAVTYTQWYENTSNILNRCPDCWSIYRSMFTGLMSGDILNIAVRRAYGYDSALQISVDSYNDWEKVLGQYLNKAKNYEITVMVLKIKELEG